MNEFRELIATYRNGDPVSARRAPVGADKIEVRINERTVCISIRQFLQVAREGSAPNDAMIAIIRELL